MSVSIDPIGDIAGNHFQHSRLAPWWSDTNPKLTAEISQELTSDFGIINIGSVDQLKIKNFYFRSISSLQLFGLDELGKP